MIYSETPRLRLRLLEKSDLPRLTELIGDWDVTKWLAVVPHPYHLSDAEEFYAALSHSDKDTRWPGPYYVMAFKNDNAIIGSVGIRPSREPTPKIGEKVLGYWLGQPYWGQGLMSEAVAAILDLSFQNPEVQIITATTDPANQSSQNVLQKAGFANLGIHPRKEPAVRGSPEIIRWELQRKNYQSGL